jgi:hypothetical protein
MVPTRAIEDGVLSGHGGAGFSFLEVVTSDGLPGKRGESRKK